MLLLPRNMTAEVAATAYLPTRLRTQAWSRRLRLRAPRRMEKRRARFEDTNDTNDTNDSRGRVGADAACPIVSVSWSSLVRLLLQRAGPAG